MTRSPVHVRTALVSALSSLSGVGIVALALAVGASSPLIASEYQYYPSTTLTLGGSFDPTNPAQAFLPCLVHDGEMPLDLGPPQTSFTSAEANTRQELYHQLHVDANLSANAFFGSGSASFSLDEKYHFEGNNEHFVIRAFTDYGRYVTKNPRLSPEARALASNPTAFRERCGTEFVQQERRMVQLVAIYSFEHVSTLKASRMAASMSASGFGVSLGGTLNESTTSSNDTTQISVDIYSVGGTGITLLRQITTKGSLPEVKTLLENYLEKMDPTHATPLGFQTGSWQSFGVDVPMEQMEVRNTILPELYFSYRDNAANLHRLGELIRSAERPGATLKVADVTAYQVTYGDLANALHELHARGLACLHDENACFPAIPPLVVHIDWPHAVFLSQWMDTDETGAPYQVRIEVPTYKIGADTPVAQGSFSLQIPNSRISEVVWQCDPNQANNVCGYSYNRTPAAGYAADWVPNDPRTFTWFRRWIGDAHQEGYLVKYQVLRTVCVENCNYEQMMLTADGKKHAAIPAWDWSGERRGLLAKNPGNKPARTSKKK